MPKRSSKDINELASSIVNQSTDESNEKNPYAVVLGRFGGLKGVRLGLNGLSGVRGRKLLAFNELSWSEL